MKFIKLFEDLDDDKIKKLSEYIDTIMYIFTDLPYISFKHNLSGGVGIYLYTNLGSKYKENLAAHKFVNSDEYNEFKDRVTEEFPDIRFALSFAIPRSDGFLTYILNKDTNWNKLGFNRPTLMEFEEQHRDTKFIHIRMS